MNSELLGRLAVKGVPDSVAGCRLLTCDLKHQTQGDHRNCTACAGTTKHGHTHCYKRPRSRGLPLALQLQHGWAAAFGYPSSASQQLVLRTIMSENNFLIKCFGTMPYSTPYSHKCQRSPITQHANDFAQDRAAAGLKPRLRYTYKALTTCCA